MHHHAPRLALGLALLLVLSSAATLATAPPTAAADFPAYDSRYHTYAEMVAEINATRDAHPDIVAISSIGKSYQGRDLWVAKVSDNVATDESEPEVMLDSLHHAREHLSLEQNLAVLRWLTEGYGTDARITKIVNTPRDLDRLRGQPRRRRVRPDRLALPLVAQEPPAERGHDRDRDRPQPQLRLPVGVLRRLVLVEVVVDLPRPSRVLGARVAGDPRLHGQPPDRRPAADQDRHHVPHGRRADPVAVRLHQDGRPGRHDDRRPRRARRPRPEDGRTNGYTAMQSSSLYVTDGDEIDWAYGHEHIFMYTFELYPSHSLVSTTARFYPPDELIAPADRTEQGRRSCCSSRPPAARTASAGTSKPTAGRCTTTSRPRAAGSRTRSGPIRRPAAPGSAPTRPPRPARPARSRPGPTALVTGAKAGSQRQRRTTSTAASTTIRSQPVDPPGDGRRADVPLLPRAQLELVVGRLLPRVRRGCRRRPDARPPGARRREYRPSGLGVGHHLDDAVGRPDGPDRVRGGGSRPRQHRRGGRRRRADQSPVSGSRTRIVGAACRAPTRRRSSPPWATDELTRDREAQPRAA